MADSGGAAAPAAPLVRCPPNFVAVAEVAVHTAALPAANQIQDDAAVAVAPSKFYSTTELPVAAN